MQKLPIVIVGLRFGRSVAEGQLIAGAGAEYMQLVGVCDLKRDVADQVAARLGVRAYYSLDEVLRDPDVPVVGLFTHPVGRADLLLRAVRAGKHVMTTKPFELDPDAALAALLEARALGRVVHLNSPSPLPSMDVATILAWQEQYALGRPIAAHWTTWISYREQPDGSWYDDSSRCPVAPIFRLGIYGINDIVRVLGEPAEAYVMGTRVFTGRPTADNAQLAIRFQNGALANVFASFCVKDAATYPDALIVNYENGTIYRSPSVCHGIGGNQQVMQLTMSDRRDGPVAQATIPYNQRSGSYQWANLYRAVHGEALPGEITPEQIVQAVRVIRAMARSEQSGKAEVA